MAKKKVTLKDLNNKFKKRKFPSSGKDDKPWFFKFEKPKAVIQIGRLVQIDCGEKSFIAPAADILGYLMLYEDDTMTGRILEKIAHKWPKNWSAALWMLEMQMTSFEKKSELDQIIKEVDATDLLEDEHFKNQFDKLVEKVKAKL